MVKLKHKFKHAKKLFVFIVLSSIFDTGKIIAQNISGKVSSNGIPLSGATIRNAIIRKITLSDIEGNFQIQGRKGDSLIISYIGYGNDTIKLNTEVTLSIFLQNINLRLGEVSIKGKQLAPLERFMRNQEEYRQIYRIGNNSQLFNAGGNFRNIGVGISIDALYSTFSKQGRNARRLQKVLLADYYDRLVDVQFNKNLVNKITGYTGQQLEDFMMTNRPSYEFVLTATEYDIITFIKRRVSGTVLQTDNPPLISTKDKSFKIKFKLPNIQPNDRPSIPDFTPKIRP